MSKARDLLLAFASGVMVAAGSKLGELLVLRATSPKQPAPSQPPPGTPAKELCRTCGHTMHRFSKTLYCTQCGYREG